nr:MAG TPA: hypothetical protein [Bacteriophage sp.]
MWFIHSCRDKIKLVFHQYTRNGKFSQYFILHQVI